ncbi:hypothetical protein FKP32DRAFT_1757075 [Trametes sanguinea]|nr:hypothetical protein FKP32DRAFT_1757075 [Trametes sanguinea]
MPLVVPVLRLAYVFLNIFDTFKVLRLPPPSARNGGQPSARAMSQRKRAMKGTMTVWMVWACFTLYERWVETFVWLFVPFYSEIKALVILFFLLTRAKGSEPIFLHLIRPAIKPYTVPLDALFDGLASAGDLLVLVASIPIQHAQSYYRRWTSALDPPEVDMQSWHRDASSAGSRPTAHRAFASETNGDARPHVSRDVSTGSMRQTRSSGTSGSSTPVHQIWRPPPAAYAEEGAFNPHSGLPTPPIDRHQVPLPPTAGSVDEWRQYPPFPSAYPPTPLPASSRLPSAGPSIAAPQPVRPSGAQFTGIAEESDEDDDRHPDSRQDFRRSLQLPREPRNPGSDGGLSDEIQMKGVQHTQTPNQTNTPPAVMTDDLADTSAMSTDDVDSYMDDDEDDFNVTLRTPHPLKLKSAEAMLSDDEMLTPPPSTIAFTISLDSQVSHVTRSTALSTTDNGSSLRTRTPSISSTVPDAPSLAGRKRRLPRYAEDNVKFNVRVSPRKARVASRTASTRASLRTAPADIRRTKVNVKEQDNPSAEDDAPSDVPSLDAKRQKTAGGRVARPKPRRSDSDRTVRGAPVRLKPPVSKVALATRPAPVRQPSSRLAAKQTDRAQLSKKPSAVAVSAAPVSTRPSRVPSGKVEKKTD